MLSCLKLAHGFSQPGDYIKKIPDDTIIRCFKKRCFRIFVYHNDHFRTVNSGKMLNGTGNSYGDIEIGSNGDTGLPYMFMMRPPPTIRYRPGTSCRRTK